MTLKTVLAALALLTTDACIGDHGLQEDAFDFRKESGHAAFQKHFGACSC